MSFNPADTPVPSVSGVWGANGFGGYDKASQAGYPTADDVGASGKLRRGSDGKEIALWITEITADFSVSGTTGQSRLHREYFPHSFNDVTLTISGNVASTQEYNRLALFVREHHWLALNAVDQGQSRDQTIIFSLNRSHAATPARRGSASVRHNQGAISSGSNQKGPYRGWQVGGYIRSIAAGAVANEVAPKFQIGFIVTESKLNANTGIWKDDDLAQDTQVLSSFAHLLKILNGGDRVQGKGFISDPSAPPPTGKVHKPSPVAPTASAPGTVAWVQAALIGAIGDIESALSISTSTNQIGGARP